MTQAFELVKGMNISLLNISDIHLKEDSFSSVKDKFKKIPSAIGSDGIDLTSVVIILSGDIASSGKAEEYAQAEKMLKELANDLKQKFQLKSVHFVSVPGNHDCDFSQNKQTRDMLIQNINEQDEEIDAQDDSLIDACCSIQGAYFDFHHELVNDNNTELTSDKKVYYKQTVRIDNFSIRFNCYNTSWISQLEERESLVYPVKYVRKLQNKNELPFNMVCSVFHHPVNWLDSSSSHSFREMIELKSDFIFTGHEHVASQSFKSSISGQYCCEVYEGGVFHSEEGESYFYAIQLNTKSSEHRAFKYTLEKDLYHPSELTNGWTSYLNNAKILRKDFPLNKEFDELLDDPGGTFEFPQKEHLKLSDIFIFPDLKKIDIRNDSPNEQDKIVKSDNVENEISKRPVVIISGDERSGKTALAHIFFRVFHKSSLAPVLLDGSKIKSSSYEKMCKVIRNTATKQYQPESIEKLMQANGEQKCLIIDNFQNAKLTPKQKKLCIQNLRKHFKHVIVINNDIITIEEQIDSLEGISNFKIQPFGYRLRKIFINNYYSIGRESENQDEKINQAEKMLDTVIGNGLIPQYPIFIMTILQLTDSTSPVDTNTGSYGYYYQFLILRSLRNAPGKNITADIIQGYLSEFANFLQTNKLWECDENKLIEFHQKYNKEYAGSLKFTTTLKKLTDCKLLSKHYDNYRFKYKYQHYYFYAKYLSDSIAENSTRSTILNLCKSLHIEKNANIVLFLTHLSKNPFIITTVLKVSKNIFRNQNPFDVNKDSIKILSEKLIEKVHIQLDNSDPTSNREKLLEERDSNEAERNEQELVEEEEYKEDSLLKELNACFKTMQILGQIVKNYSGSIKSDNKLNIIIEGYNLGLRSLSYYFELIDSKETIEYFTHILKEDGKKIDNSELLQKAVNKLAFSCAEIITFSIIKRIALSVGVPDLKETYNQILEDTDNNSHHLVDMAVKLEQCNFPDNIKDMKSKFEKNTFSYTLLKHLVADHFYFFKTDIKVRQKACETLEIPIKNEVQGEFYYDPIRKLK